MGATERLPVGEADLERLLALARLELTAERRQVVGPALDMIIALMDTFEDIDIGETPPATAFDPRWE
jgi:Asp-tRNA(Asn)/Glu-tRNA(Gln) amidotransferase C subunit